MEGPTSSNTNSGQEHMTLSTASSSSGVTDGYISPRIPLHALISHKKKEKNWAGEYIDLSSLQEEAAEDICLNLRTGAMSSRHTKEAFYEYRAVDRCI